MHYKDEEVFSFEKYVTQLKENFHVLEKGKNENLTGKQQVDAYLRNSAYNKGDKGKTDWEGDQSYQSINVVISFANSRIMIYPFNQPRFVIVELCRKHTTYS